MTFQGKYALMTGAGAGSIGADVLQGLISGGAHVVVTTSRFSRQVTEYYQAMYARYGARGSQLIVVPFNQGSKQDVEALIDYIYDAKAGLGWDLDFVVPFAAISENGRQIDGIDSKSELAHRIMLTNLVRLLGCVKTEKSRRGFETRPAQVILPLSPNHGTFGNDGLYSESKLALETLFNRWHSEDWADYLTICGAVIGWTRGTGSCRATTSWPRASSATACAPSRSRRWPSTCWASCRRPSSTCARTSRSWPTSTAACSSSPTSTTP